MIFLKKKGSKSFIVFILNFCFIFLSFPLKEYKNRIVKIQLVEITKKKKKKHNKQ